MHNSLKLELCPNGTNFTQFEFDCQTAKLMGETLFISAINSLRARLHLLIAEKHQQFYVFFISRWMLRGCKVESTLDK